MNTSKKTKFLFLGSLHLNKVSIKVLTLVSINSGTYKNRKKIEVKFSSRKKSISVSNFPPKCLGYPI
jgi:hypothetical protein